MGKHGLFSELCRGLDCMEQEMHGLCEKLRGKGHCKQCCEQPQKPCLPPDFRPPCGRDTCCCEKK